MNLNFNAVTGMGLDQVKKSTQKFSESIAKISSGKKLLSMGDDSAGYVKTLKLESSLRRIESTKGNIQDALSYTQVSNSFIEEIIKTVNRMGEINRQAMDNRYDDKDKDAFSHEFNQLSAQLMDIIGNGQEGNDPHGTYNETDLFGPHSLVGRKLVTTDDEGVAPIEIPEINFRAGDIVKITGQKFDFSAGGDDLDALFSTIKSAVDQVTQELAKMSGVEFRLKENLSGNAVIAQNIEAAFARIRDTDIAAESTHMAKYNIMARANMAVLAQANMQPQKILDLLR
tara:strand:+ start:352 stop:1206 length:855 start_codon:yes stop_codon:yes gene_type:complete